MKLMFVALALLLPFSVSAEVFRCGEPKGVTMWSNQGHRPAQDGFTGVEPVVIVEGNEMTVVWGDTRAKGGSGSERAWKARIVNRSPEAISAVALDVSPIGVASMLYTMDMKRGYLYMSTHKKSETVGVSTVSSYVSKCSS